MILMDRDRTISPIFWRCVAVAGSFFLMFYWAMTLAGARDLGQWENQDPKIRKWFNSLTIPDLPGFSCCGKSDAYWPDIYEVEGDQYVAVITDTRDDAPLGRPHIPNGTRIPVPNHRIKWDQATRPATAGSSSAATRCSAICRPGGGVKRLRRQIADILQMRRHDRHVPQPRHDASTQISTRGSEKLSPFT